MQKELSSALASLSLGGVRYFDTIGSTNDEALAWAAQDAPDGALVIADEQTSGRGRAGRRWFTPKGTALAFSLILRPTTVEAAAPTLITGLAAVAVVEGLKTACALEAQIKWPNDVLIRRRKVAGILTESVWRGNCLDAMVIGIGVNVLRGSHPADQELRFPATDLETEIKRAQGEKPDAPSPAVDRVVVLREILASLFRWRSRLGSDALRSAWEKYLAFRGEPVRVQSGSEQLIVGQVVGLAADGSLRLVVGNRIQIIPFGEIHLRPVV